MRDGIQILEHVGRSERHPGSALRNFSMASYGLPWSLELVLGTAPYPPVVSLSSVARDLHLNKPVSSAPKSWPSDGRSFIPILWVLAFIPTQNRVPTEFQEYRNHADKVSESK